MFFKGKEPSLITSKHFIDAVSEEKSAVEFVQRHFGQRQQFFIDDSKFHFLFSGYKRCFPYHKNIVKKSNAR